jgi:hypothetical protein
MGITGIIALVETVKTDFENLAREHNEAAANERIWCLGSEGEDAIMHLENEKLNQIIANFFTALSKEETVIALIEEYAEE